MANANVPRGLVPRRRSSGEPYNSAGNLYYVPATNPNPIFVGDPVTFLTAAGDGKGVPACVGGAVGGGLVGAMMGRVVGGTQGSAIPILRDSPVYMPALTAGYVLICDDPDALYEVQESGNMGAYASGRNVNLLAGAGSVTTGYSGWQIDSTTLATTNTLQFKILRGLVEPDNDVTLPNAKWLCRLNANALTNPLGI